MYDLNIDGFMVEAELMQIEKWASMVPENGTIVEFGSYKGKSSYAWAKSCHPSVKVYCIDLHNKWYDEFLENTKDCNNIIPIIGRFPRKVTYHGPLVDVFFIDSNHKNPDDIDAINLMMMYMKPNSIICGHDYHRDERDLHTDVENNINELEKRLNQKVTLYPGTSLWSFRI